MVPDLNLLHHSNLSANFHKRLRMRSGYGWRTSTGSWKSSANSDIKGETDDYKPRFRSHTVAPALLHAAHESRREGLRFYKRLSLNRIFSRAYIN